jgi:hypothetical protein
MKYWLKGALIAGAVSLIFNLIHAIVVITGSSLMQSTFIPLAAIFPLIFGMNSLPLIILISIVGNFILYFIIGALIGWMIGKIKSTK